MPKRKAIPDFETDGRLPNNRRGNLARLQVHALEPTAVAHRKTVRVGDRSSDPFD